MWSEQDKKDLESRGISLEEANHQLQIHRHGPKALEGLSPCRIGDGIFQIEEEKIPGLLSLYEKAKSSGRISKFIPASGVASRMFQVPIQYLNTKTNESPKGQMKMILDHMDEFAFYSKLKTSSNKEQSKDPRVLLKKLLFNGGMNYGEKPKALIEFHQYGEYCATALEEHLWEAAGLLSDRKGIIRVHFTLSKKFHEEAERHLNHISSLFKQEGLVLEVSFSAQGGQTETLSLEDSGDLLRNHDGRLIFRPGGHGALIHNLAAHGGDVVFIKNIDNIQTRPRQKLIQPYQAMLLGHLLSLQDQIFKNLIKLDRGNPSAAELDEFYSWCGQHLGIRGPSQFMAWKAKEKHQWLYQILHRPLRVCSMVPQEGKPGGGPFWLQGPAGHVNCQIIETVQMDLERPEQREALARSTHFNPVEMACALRDHQGQPYSLLNYVNEGASFLAKKDFQGRPIQVLEKPGLWNGSMAHWNTVFVELPAFTFSPVKEVGDLLQPEHQF